MIVIPTILTINMISVFKIWVFGGICLSLFADSLLFDHMLKTSFHDGVDSLQDLIERDMSLGVILYIIELIKIEVGHLTDFQLSGPTCSGWWTV